MISPDIVSVMKAFINFHFCLKPFFGYGIDQIMKKISKKKYIFMVTSVIKYYGYFTIGTFHLPLPLLIFNLFLISFFYMIENILAETMLMHLTQEENKKDKSKVNNQISYYFGFKAIGSLIGDLSGGRIIDSFGNQSAYLITSIFPILIFCHAIIYDEEVVKTPPVVRSFKREMSLMKNLVLKKEILILVIFGVLINFTPDLEVLYIFYMTDHLGFTKTDLANFMAAGTLFYLSGLIFYQSKLQSVKPKIVFVISNTIFWLINLSFLLVVLEVVQSWGINLKLFCMLTLGAMNFLSKTNILPILAVMCLVCPPGLEATTVTFYTALLKISYYCSLNMGAILMNVFEVTKADYSKFWQLLVVQNSYIFIVLVLIIFISIPNIDRKEAAKIKEQIRENVQTDNENKSNIESIEKSI
jgi:MFS family permease